MPRNPASPNFCHISLGNAFSRSVFAAISSGISRRANSCTLSRSSSRSDWEGGVKLTGCLVEAWRIVESGATRVAWRRERVSRRGAMAAIVSAVSSVGLQKTGCVQGERKCAVCWAFVGGEQRLKLSRGRPWIVENARMGKADMRRHQNTLPKAGNNGRR